MGWERGSGGGSPRLEVGKVHRNGDSGWIDGDLVSLSGDFEEMFLLWRDC